MFKFALAAIAALTVSQADAKLYAVVLDDEESSDFIEMKENASCGGKKKVYSFDHSKGTCGETCISGFKVPFARKIDSGLKVASSSSEPICEKLGYKFRSTITVSKLGNTVKVDEFVKN